MDWFGKCRALVTGWYQCQSRNSTTATGPLPLCPTLHRHNGDNEAADNEEQQPDNICSHIFILSGSHHRQLQLQSIHCAHCPPRSQSDKICKYCKQSAVGQLIISPPSHIAWIKYFLTHLNIFCFSSVDTSHVMNKYQLSYTLRRYLKYFIYKIISIITINTWKGLA